MTYSKTIIKSLFSDVPTDVLEKNIY